MEWMFIIIMDDQYYENISQIKDTAAMWVQDW